MKLYKHVAFRDVAVEVVKKFYIKEKDMYALKVMWWNVCPSHSPFPMGVTQRIKVGREDWQTNWKPWQEGDWHVYNTRV